MPTPDPLGKGKRQNQQWKKTKSNQEQVQIRRRLGTTQNDNDCSCPKRQHRNAGGVSDATAVQNQHGQDAENDLQYQSVKDGASVTSGDWKCSHGVRSGLKLLFDRTVRSNSFHIREPISAFPICKQDFKRISRMNIESANLQDDQASGREQNLAKGF